MNSDLEPIQIVWLKRDLRLEDHPPLTHALKSGRRVLLLFVFEKLLLEDPHYSPRHIDFIKQSICALNEQLKTFNSKILTTQGHVISALESLSQKYQIEKIWAHQETGVMSTYHRDLNLIKWCKKEKIPFEEKLQQGVFRGLKNRVQWLKKWDDLMNQPIQKTPLKKKF